MSENILIMTNTYPSVQKPYSGVFVKNQVEELACRGNYGIDVYAMRRKFTGLFGSIVKYSDFFVRFIPFLFKKYDVIHLHFFYPLIWLVLFYRMVRPKTAIMLTIHGSDIHGRFRTRFTRKLHKIAIGKVDYIQAVGIDLANEFKEIFGREVDLISPAGINKKVFRPNDGKVGDRYYDFIFVGSFVRRKGVDLIIEAMSLLKNNRINYCFIGSGIEEENIQIAAKSYNITIMNNLSQAEISSQLNDSKFFLFPSRYEPFGLVVTEALYCGTPAVVSRVGGLKKQVRDGVNGIFIEALDAQDVAVSMNRALDMTELEYRVMSEAAEESNKEYSLEVVTDTLENIYRMLIESRLTRNISD